VLVTFNSDPNGATVANADGTILGVTPVLTEVPFGDTAIEYVVRKEGYKAKIASIVPNHPSPFFAVLEPRAALVPPPVPLPPIGPPNADALPPTELAPKVSKRHHSRARSFDVEPSEGDDDGVMGPSPP
jgi:hypothetical protein